MPNALAHATLADAKSFLGITSQDTDAILDQCIDRASAWVDRYCGRTFAAQRHYEVRTVGGVERIAVRNPPIRSLNWVGSSREVMLAVSSTDGTDVAAAVSVIDGALVLRRVASTGVATKTSLSLDAYPTAALLAAQVSLTAGFSAAVERNGVSRHLAPAASVDCLSSAGRLEAFSVAATGYECDEEAGILYGRAMDRWRSVLIDYDGGYETIPYDVQHASLIMVGNFFRDRTRDSGLASESLGGYSYSVKSGEDMQREIDGLLGAHRRIR